MSGVTNLLREKTSGGSPVVALPGARALSPPPGNLPLEMTSFVGREKELAGVKKLLADHRLLTLTGPGGCGKTRLALRAARHLAERFEHGAWLVELASLSDPNLVPRAVASALGLRGAPGYSASEVLAEHFELRDALLVLDNCEHLIGGCATLSDALLRACPNLSILATSRQALGVAGERLLPVPPLSLSEPQYPPNHENLARCEAVRLFVERASAVVPAFALTGENAGAIGRLCRSLDGIPLAIEFAATKARVLSVEQIAARLDDSFLLLTGGSRMASPRQRALRTAIDWSHDLLSTDERALFRRLSMFAGGFTLEAAEEVCAGGGIEKDGVLDLLASLVDKSLVQPAAEGGGESRYRLLETVRQYARERLEARDETEEYRRRHAAWSLTLAEEAEPELKGPQQVAWLERLETEHDNLRAAMRWLLQEDEVENAVRLSWALWFFWYLRGHQGEGYRYTGEALERSDILATGMRAKAVLVKGIMSYGLSSPEHTLQLFEESARLFRQARDRSGLAIALGGMGVGALMQGDAGRASTLLEESLKLYRELGDRWGMSETLGYLGMVPLGSGDYARATRHFEEALALSREIENRHSGYVALHNLALIARYQGDPTRAVRLYVEALRLVVEAGARVDIAYCLEGLAGPVEELGEPERAARLFGASEALLEAAGAPLYVQAQDRAVVERVVDALRCRLGETAFAVAWARGREMKWEQAVAYALEPVQETPAQKQRAEGLSVRELEVLSLVAEGLTDRQVAEKLRLSPRTVGQHLRSVYNKLGVSSRAAATREALERALI